MEETTIDMRQIELTDLWEIFIQRWLVIVLAAVIVTTSFFVGVQITYDPLYESTATLYILRQDESEITSSTATNDFNLALKVVNDCTFLLKSHSVLDEVIAGENLDMEYDALYKRISTNNPSDTRVLEVTVQAETPEDAKIIVDAICDIGTQKIEDAMGFKQVNLYEYGILEDEACNKTPWTTYVLAGMVAAVLTYAVFVAAFLLDGRIRSDEDIERYLELSVLGEIPIADAPQKNRYGYYRAYGNKPYGSAKDSEGGKNNSERKDA